MVEDDWEVEQNETFGTWTFLVCRNLIGKRRTKRRQQGKKKRHNGAAHGSLSRKAANQLGRIARDEIQEQEQV
jgi:hypothetical protein